jgi:DNA polymerase IIIc chi subunit
MPARTQDLSDCRTGSNRKVPGHASHQTCPTVGPVRTACHSWGRAALSVQPVRLSDQFGPHQARGPEAQPVRLSDQFGPHQARGSEAPSAQPVRLSDQFEPPATPEARAAPSAQPVRLSDQFGPHRARGPEAHSAQPVRLSDQFGPHRARGPEAHSAQPVRLSDRFRPHRASSRAPRRTCPTVGPVWIACRPRAPAPCGSFRSTCPTVGPVRAAPGPGRMGPSGSEAPEASPSCQPPLIGWAGDLGATSPRPGRPWPCPRTPSASGRAPAAGPSGAPSRSSS